MLPELKKELPWLKTDCYSQVLQATTKHLEQAMKNWFSGRGRKPRFKAKKKKQSISFPQNVTLVNDCLKIPQVGLVKTKITQSIEGEIKTVTISVTTTGKYYASIGLDLGEREIEQSTQGQVLGIDLGLKDYCYGYNGQDSWSVKHPKWLKGHEGNLRKQQKQLSRRKKGSKRREKARKLVARVHERLSNARQDFLHKLSRKISDENQVVIVENLNIKGMVKKRCAGMGGLQQTAINCGKQNIKPEKSPLSTPAEVPSAKERAPRHRKLSKSISQSGWGMFLNFLEYKLKDKGGVLVEIDRFFPSSQLCSNCGHKYQDLQLSEREWTCSVCETKHSRDENAAKNIRLEGMRILGLGHSPHGDGVRLQSCSEATVGEVSTTSVA